VWACVRIYIYTYIIGIIIIIMSALGAYAFIYYNNSSYRVMRGSESLDRRHYTRGHALLNREKFELPSPMIMMMITRTDQACVVQT